MAPSSVPCRLVIGLSVLAGASAQGWEMLTVQGASGLCSGAKLCGSNGVANMSAVCDHTWSSGDFQSEHPCGTNEGCIQALCISDASCGGYSRNADGTIYWLMPADVWMSTPNSAYQCWKAPEATSTTAAIATTAWWPSTTAAARPEGVHPGDTVEVQCESEGRYHPAAVHNVSSAGIVVVYELMGHLYYCTPKRWRTVAADGGEVCGPHGGILPAWGGDKCCPTTCGECGTVDCHTRPGGRDSCCTRRIPDHHVCGRDGRGAPCTLLPALPFAQGRRLRGDADAAEGETGALARLLGEWSPAAWFGAWTGF